METHQHINLRTDTRFIIAMKIKEKLWMARLKLNKTKNTIFRIPAWNAIKQVNQAEAEVVPRSSLVEIKVEVEVGVEVEVQLRCNLDAI